MLSTLTPEEIEAVLHQQYIGRLGCHAEDLTYVVPVGYAYDGTYIYGHSYSGMKTDMVKKNPSVCFQVDNIDSAFHWQSVIAWGELEILSTDAARLHAGNLMLSRGLPFGPPDLLLPAVIVYRIRITKKTGRSNKLPAHHERGTAAAPSGL